MLSIPKMIWIALLVQAGFLTAGLYRISRNRYSKTGFWFRWVLLNALAAGVYWIVVVIVPQI